MPSTSPTAALITVIGGLVIAIIGGYFGWRNSGRSSISKDTREWLETAMKEARQAKADAGEAEESARKATVAANAATDQAHDAQRQLRAVTAQTDELMTWISRVVRSASEIEPQHVNDPRVQRLLTVINGGPASMSSSHLHRPEPDRR